MDVKQQDMYATPHLCPDVLTFVVIIVVQRKKSKKKGNSKLTAIGCHKNGTAWLYKAVMRPEYANKMANSEDPDQTAPKGAV